MKRTCGAEKRCCAFDEMKPGTGTGYSARRYIECGRLSLDTLESAAYIDRDNLNLSEEQFDALFLLIQGRPLTLEVLYKNVWDHPDGQEYAEAALSGMESLMEKVNAAGQGILRIDITPKGYFFRYMGGEL
ncbi:MAG: hypothetical protein LBQ16_02900 [Gracilibacteraceae bacterium]|jgi:DNA-binding response OmpR family regulator|nr:hypothetical protein [Gracilibacteraceae bacterium]